MKNCDILVIGDINPDIIITGAEKYPGPGEEILVNDINVTTGGGAAITSLALAKLGLNVTLYGCIGKDVFSEMLLKDLTDVGVDISNIIRLDDVKAGSTIAISNEIDRSFITYRGALDKLDLYSISDELINKCDYCFLHNYNHVKLNEYIHLANRVNKFNKKLFFDVGYDDSEQWDPKIFNLIKKVDYFAPDELEAISFSGKKNIKEALTYLNQFCSNIIVKAGEDGAYAILNNEIINVPTFSTEVIDTTGAGDSFDAGFIYGVIKGYSLENSLRLANFLGSLSVSAIGGSTGIPKTEKLWGKINKLNIIQ